MGVIHQIGRVTVYIIPEKYDNKKTSGLEPVKVEKGGENVFNFDIKST